MWSKSYMGEHQLVVGLDSMREAGRRMAIAQRGQTLRGTERCGGRTVVLLVVSMHPVIVLNESQAERRSKHPKALMHRLQLRT